MCLHNWTRISYISHFHLFQLVFLVHAVNWSDVSVATATSGVIFNNSNNNTDADPAKTKTQLNLNTIVKLTASYTGQE